MLISGQRESLMPLVCEHIDKWYILKYSANIVVDTMMNLIDAIANSPVALTRAQESRIRNWKDQPVIAVVACAANKSKATLCSSVYLSYIILRKLISR